MLCLRVHKEYCESTTHRLAEASLAADAVVKAEATQAVAGGSPWQRWLNVVRNTRLRGQSPCTLSTACYAVVPRPIETRLVYNRIAARAARASGGAMPPKVFGCLANWHGPIVPWYGSSLACLCSHSQYSVVKALCYFVPNPKFVIHTFDFVTSVPQSHGIVRCVPSLARRCTSPGLLVSAGSLTAWIVHHWRSTSRSFWPCSSIQRPQFVVCDFPHDRCAITIFLRLPQQRC